MSEAHGTAAVVVLACGAVLRRWMPDCCSDGRQMARCAMYSCSHARRRCRHTHMPPSCPRTCRELRRAAPAPATVAREVAAGRRQGHLRRVWSARKHCVCCRTARATHRVCEYGCEYEQLHVAASAPGREQTLNPKP